MPQTKPIVSIENVVASASVDQKMDLNEITRTFPDVEYHPDQFPGLVFRLKVPKTATLIFTSGKMVCTGAKSEDMSRKPVKTVVQRLRKGGIKVKKEATVTIHRMLDTKTVILLFSSGKLVCTGAKKEADVYRSVNNLHALLEEKKLMIYD